MLPVSSDCKLVPVEGIRVGENGTFNSKDIVQLFLLVNYLKPLCLVAEQPYSRRIVVILHGEPRRRSLVCGVAISALLARSGTSLRLTELWNCRSLTVVGSTFYLLYGQLPLALIFYSSFSDLTVL